MAQYRMATDQLFPSKEAALKYKKRRMRGDDGRVPPGQRRRWRVRKIVRRHRFTMHTPRGLVERAPGTYYIVEKTVEKGLRGRRDGVRGRKKTTRCKFGRVKSGPRKGMCRLRPKRRK